MRLAVSYCKIAGTSFLPKLTRGSKYSSSNLGASARAAAIAIYWNQGAHARDARSVTAVVTEQTITLLSPSGVVVRDDLITDLL